MSLFGTGFHKDAEKETDFQKFTLDSDVYEAKIKQAFAGKSKQGANCVTFVFEVMQGGKPKEYTETVYVSNRNGENTYVNKKDNTIHQLPGFLLVNNICLMACGKTIMDMDGTSEPALAKVYDSESKTNVTKEVPGLPLLYGKVVKLAILEKEEEKTSWNDSTSRYEGTGEYFLKNEIVRVFDNETLRTAPEIRDGKETPEAYNYWIESNKGKVKEAPRTQQTNVKKHDAPKPSGLFGSK